MSKSCFSPGIINLVSNLITTTSEHNMKFTSWLSEYADGMGNEIYRMKLSEKMDNRTFADIAGFVFKKNYSIVFALEIKTNGRTIIRLNPSDFIVNNIARNQIYVYLICQDKKTADEIEILDMNKDEQTAYYNEKALAGKKKRGDEEEDDADEEFAVGVDGVVKHGGHHHHKD